MPARSLNKVLLIGNLTRDPELRYTPAGNAVCSFGLATNRYWATDTGERREDTQFHRIVAWNKLAEICSQILGKGDKVYLEGRLQTRQWTAQDGTQRTTTEIVLNEMILLRSQRGRVTEEVPEEMSATEEVAPPEEPAEEPAAKPGKPGEEPGEEAGVKSEKSVAEGEEGEGVKVVPKDEKKKSKKKEEEATEEEGNSKTSEEEVELDKIPF
jgi:single-strand DNA-binding protein